MNDLQRYEIELRLKDTMVYVTDVVYRQVPEQ